MEEQLHIDYSGNVIEVLKQINSLLNASSKSTEQFQKSATDELSKVSKSVNGVNLAALNQNIQNLGQGFEDLNRPGLDFNSNLKELSALTGTTGKDLDSLGEKAKASALEFGGSATDSLNNYKTILSRLGPDIAKDQGSLVLMEKNVRILSKTMGGDAAGAVDALTTAALQFGVDLSNPKTAAAEMTKMMDIMANSAQEGAAEVPQISAALKVSGVAAKQANVSFIETNAALQALVQGGKEGSEAGMALRNVLGKMAGEDVIPKEAAAKLKALGVDMDIVSNTALPFTERLRELKKAQGDATIMAQVFGTENAAAANILLSSADAQDELAGKIGKVGGAQAQANIVMESTAEKLARMQAGIDDAKISFFELTGGATAYLGPATEVLRTMTSFAPIFNGAKSAVLALATAKGREMLMEKASTAARIVGAAVTKTVTAAQWLWNAALSANPIGVVIIAVAALAAGVYALTQAFSSGTAAEQLNAEVKQRVIDKTADQRAELDMLFTSLKSAKVGSDEYNKTLEDLEKMQPGIVDKYNLQAGALEDINKAQKEMIENIDAIAQAEAWKEISKEKYKEAFTKKAEGPSGWDKFVYGDKTANTLNAMGYTSAKMSAQNANKEYAAATQTDAYKRATGGNGVSNGDGTVVDENQTNLGTTNGYSKNTKDKASSSGAGTVKSISVQIANLMSGNIIIQASNIKEGAAQIKQEITEALVGAVRDFEVSI